MVINLTSRIEKYKHIIWDWNGTLLDDVNLCIDIMNGLLIKYKLELISVERYKDIFTIPVSDYYKSLGFDLSNGAFELIGKEFMDVYELRKNECSLFPEVELVLEALKSKGIKQSVLSAYKHDTLVEIIKSYKIDKYFQFITGISDIYAKGKIEQGKVLLKLIKCDRDRILMIGDSVHDYDVADSLGIDCILITHGHQSRNQLEKSGAKLTDNLTELLC